LNLFYTSIKKLDIFVIFLFLPNQTHFINPYKIQ
jgi:hypothetical protein